MKKALYLLLLLAGFTLAACSGSTEQQDVVTVEDKEDPNMPADARFGMKSGIITYEASMLLMKQDVVIYFDNYGKDTRTEIHFNMLGKEVNNITISDSAWVHSWDPESMTGSRFPMDVKSPDNINFNKLTDELKKELKIKEEGSEVVLGRNCVVYSLNAEASGIKGTYVIWKGIALRTETVARGQKVEMKAVKIEENVPIPPDRFKVPSGINFRELKSASELTS